MTTITTAERLARHLDQAGEHVRQANHTSGGGPIPLNDAYAVVGGLDELIRRLPQLVGYLARTAEGADPDGYYHDHGHDPGTAITAAGDAFAAVLAGLDAIGTHTRAAHSALGQLGQRRDEEED